MNIRTNFDGLVRDLDDQTLGELTNSVASEARRRAERSAIQVEGIRVGMTISERNCAVEDISRVLRSLDR